MNYEENVNEERGLNMDFLYLSEEDMIKAGVKNMVKCIDIMEDTFRLLYHGDYRMGGPNNSEHGLRIKFPRESKIQNMPLDAPGRWFTVMPAYLGGKYHVFGIKSYGANQDNPLYEMPRSILMMQLLDVATGIPLAFMSANILSAMRTGAVSGLFARYFAPHDAKKIAVIGPGVIGRYSLDGIMSACPEIEEISVLGRSNKNRAIFKNYCIEQKYQYKKYNDCSTIAEACSDADIIITANSQAKCFREYPLIDGKNIKPGACIIVTSAIRVNREYLDDPDNNCIFVADDKRMYVENRGIDAQPETEEEKKTITVKDALHEWLTEERNVINMPELINSRPFIRDDRKTYICASGGIPVEDVSWAYECYRNAVENEIGVKLKMWDKSEL